MTHLVLWNSSEFSKDTPTRPLGVHQLASYLRVQGYKVKVLDFCSFMTTKDLVLLTTKFITKDTFAIGVSNTFWDSNANYDKEPLWVIKARSIIESLYPKLDWLLGGSRNSYISLNCNYSWIKFTGYAENSVLRYLDEKSGCKKFRNEFDIQLNCGHYMTDDLNISASEVLPIELSRGCQFKCRFCRFAELGKKKNTYIRNYDLIKNELLYNYERYGVTRYTIMDDTANESTEKLEALAEIAQSLPFKLEWVGYIRLDLIARKPETAKLLLDTGLRGCYFGVESFNPAASMIVGKGWHGKQGKEFLLKLKEEWKNQVAYELGFIVGLNGETSEDLDETQQWCIDNKIYSWRWTALSIVRNPVLNWKSEFDLEYEKYGYKFPLGENYLWTSDYWDATKAGKKTDELNEARKSLVFINPWHAANVAGLGYQFDDLIKFKPHELNYEEIRTKTKYRLTEYINYQKSL